MITGVHDIYYNVTDMKRAVEFYQKAFSMTVEHASEHWTSLKLGGVMIGLHWMEGEAIPTYPRDSHGGHCGGTLTLQSNNVAEDRKHLESLGAKILGEMDAPWGHMLVFEDLDGNILKLQNPKY